MKLLPLSLIIYFFSLFSSCSQLTAESNSPIPAVTRGAYLQVVTANSIIVRWRTSIATESKVSYGKTPGLGLSATIQGQTTEHIVTLNGLEPSTRYFYNIGTSTLVLQGDSLNNFITAPAPGSFTPTRLWVTGDFGNGSQAQKDVRDAFKNYSDKSTTNLWIWLGDNAYASGTDAQYQSYVFDVYPEQLKQIPLYPSPGNHDYANVGYQSVNALTTNFDYYSLFTMPQSGEAGGMPSGTPKYYSFNYSNIHFISLDSYGALNNPGSPMFEWLVKDLSLNTQRWTVVYFHHAPYTKGTHNSDTEIELIDMRTHIVPLLETFKVDLVLSGHSHVNERSYLINGHYGSSETFDESMKRSQNNFYFTKNVPYEGTIYAVCGTSGQNPGPPQADAPMPCMYFNDYASNCSMIIDVNLDILNAKYLTATGAIADEFTIKKTGPESPLSTGESSCEISYHPGTEIIYFSLLLTKSESIRAGIYTIKGEIINEFKQIPSVLNSGYNLQAVSINNSVYSSGIYLVKIQVGEKLFVKKIFIKS